MSELKKKRVYTDPTKSQWQTRCMAAENTVKAQDIELRQERGRSMMYEAKLAEALSDKDRLRKVAHGWFIAWAIALTFLAIIAAARMIGGAQ